MIDVPDGAVITAAIMLAWAFGVVSVETQPWGIVGLAGTLVVAMAVLVIVDPDGVASTPGVENEVTE